MTIAEPNLLTLEDALRAVRELHVEVAELSTQLARTTERAYDYTANPEFDSLRIVGERGTVEIGQIGKHYFGIKVTGRGRCSDLYAGMMVDDGEHSVPTTPHVIMDVNGPAGTVSSSSSNVVTESPSTLWLSQLGDRNEVSFRFGGYADDMETDVDHNGSWTGRLELADLSGFGPTAVVEPNLLDDLMRLADLRKGSWWRATDA